MTGGGEHNSAHDNPQSHNVDIISPVFQMRKWRPRQWFAQGHPELGQLRSRLFTCQAPKNLLSLSVISSDPGKWIPVFSLILFLCVIRQWSTMYWACIMDQALPLAFGMFSKYTRCLFFKPLLKPPQGRPPSPSPLFVTVPPPTQIHLLLYFPLQSYQYLKISYMCVYFFTVFPQWDSMRAGLRSWCIPSAAMRFIIGA